MSHPKRPPLPGSERILKKLRAVCLGFPGACEKEAWGHHGDGRISVWCNSHVDAQRFAVEDDPVNFYVPPYVGPKGWIGMRLDKGIGWKRAEAVLRQAYEGSAAAAKPSSRRRR